MQQIGLRGNELITFTPKLRFFGYFLALKRRESKPGSFGSFSWPWQRSLRATPTKACSICSPQPDQVGFWHLLQVTREHIFTPYSPVTRTATSATLATIAHAIRPITIGRAPIARIALQRTPVPSATNPAPSKSLLVSTIAS